MNAHQIRLLMALAVGGILNPSTTTTVNNAARSDLHVLLFVVVVVGFDVKQIMQQCLTLLHYLLLLWHGFMSHQQLRS